MTGSEAFESSTRIGSLQGKGSERMRIESLRSLVIVSTLQRRVFKVDSCIVVNGELTHRDSLSNVEILKRGDIQMTSTGTGIRHR
jgi:hypothetical protein